MNSPWCIYILRCRNGKFYIGITNNPIKRTERHNRGLGSQYTRHYGPATLVYIEWYKNKSEARKREIQLKGWTHRKKSFLINNKLFGKATPLDDPS